VKVLDLEDHLAWLAVPLREALVHFATHHVADQLFDVQGFRRLRGHNLAVAQDCDRIADAEELLQLVTDVDARHPMLFECPQDLHELIDFSLCQRAGGLVEDQDARILGQRLSNLCHLHFADSEMLDDGLRPEIQLVIGRDLQGVGVEPVPVDRAVLDRFFAKVDILADRHVGDQGQLLVHDGDALFSGLVDRLSSKLELLAFVRDRAFVHAVGIDTRQDLDQG